MANSDSVYKSGVAGALTEEMKTSTLTTEYANDSRCRILSLDGGGAKGFYTLGVSVDYIHSDQFVT